MSGCRFCSKQVIGRGLCRNHYEREWRNGTISRFDKRDRGTLESRLISKADTNGPNECWIWRGNINGYGYGMIWRDGKSVRAHRVSYELFVGPITETDVICHRCDNPKCVNPEHLFKGTRLDNNRDCAAKGRRPKGAGHWNARLTDEAVAHIRTSSEPQKTLANRYGVTQSHISRLKKWEVRR